LLAFGCVLIEMSCNIRAQNRALLNTRWCCADPFADPFTDEKANDSSTTKDYVHIRIQQRNGRKSLTTVQVGTPQSLSARVHSDHKLKPDCSVAILQGIQKSFDYKKILKALKKDYCCNGTVVEDKELGQVIQVQGDQRKNIADFLTQVLAATFSLTA
jgi:translation initiation factor 1